MHNTGRASSYSTAGAANWITGFGGEGGIDDGAAIISTDNSGCATGGNNVSSTDKSRIEAIVDFATKIVADLFGANPKDPNCNYTGRMNGTSAAAPTVSGVAALILQSNPALNWRDVGFIMAKTARKVDADIATGARAAAFTANGGTVALALDLPWQTNSAGFNFHNRYGFGLIDATAAVNLAQNYTAPAGRRAANLQRAAKRPACHLGHLLEAQNTDQPALTVLSSPAMGVQGTISACNSLCRRPSWVAATDLIALKSCPGHVKCWLKVLWSILVRARLTCCSAWWKTATGSSLKMS